MQILNSPPDVRMHLKQTQYKRSCTDPCTSILHAGDKRLEVRLSFPLIVSGTGAELLTEVFLNHSHVIRV